MLRLMMRGMFFALIVCGFPVFLAQKSDAARAFRVWRLTHTAGHLAVVRGKRTERNDARQQHKQEQNGQKNSGGGGADSFCCAKAGEQGEAPLSCWTIGRRREFCHKS